MSNLGTIGGDGEGQLNENETDIMKDVDFEYWGDGDVKTPTNLTEAIDVWKNLYEEAKVDEDLKVVHYKISPLDMYCGQTDVILNRFEIDIYSVR